MRKNLMLEQIEQILIPIVADAEVALVDVDLVKETGRHFLRVFIDKPGGIGTDDCEKVSRALDAALEQNELIPMAYTMEVSSRVWGVRSEKTANLCIFREERSMFPCSPLVLPAANSPLHFWESKGERSL